MADVYMYKHRPTVGARRPPDAPKAVWGMVIGRFGPGLEQYGLSSPSNNSSPWF